jgi:hypothetical protein
MKPVAGKERAPSKAWLLSRSKLPCLHLVVNFHCCCGYHRDWGDVCA